MLGVAALNSIPDCNVSLFLVIGIVALASNVRLKMISGLVKRLVKGKVVKMMRKAIAGPWWAPTCAAGALALTAPGGSG